MDTTLHVWTGRAPRRGGRARAAALLGALALAPALAPALAAGDPADEVARRFLGGVRPAPPVRPAPAPEAPGEQLGSRPLFGAAGPPGPAATSPEPRALDPPRPFPGRGAEQAPGDFRVLRRQVKVKARPVVGDLALEHHLELAPDRFTRTEYRFWLAAEAELSGVETPWGAPEVIRRGDEVLLRLAYAPYRDRFEVVWRTRVPAPRPLQELRRGQSWTPEAGGPVGAAEISVWTPPSWAALVEGELTAREAHGAGTVHHFRSPPGEPPLVLVGPWTPLAGPRVDLYALGAAGPGDQELLTRLDRVVALGARALDLPARYRLPVVLMPSGARPLTGGSLLLLDPDDAGWTRSWGELSRRVLAAAWGVPEQDADWVDEAVPAYLALLAEDQGGPRWPQEVHPGVALEAPPKGGWSRARARWAERMRGRGVPVLRGLRALLGRDEFAALLVRLRARAPRGNGVEELRQALGRPDLDPFVRHVVERGASLDFQVVEVASSGALRRGDLQGDVYRTKVRLRLGRGARFAGPVALRIETDYGTLHRRLDWKRPDTELVLHTRSRVRRVEVDPERWYPDPHREDNVLAFQGAYGESMPLATELVGAPGGAGRATGG